MIDRIRHLFTSSFKVRLLVNVVLSYIIAFLVYSSLSVLLSEIFVIPIISEGAYIISFIFSLFVFLFTFYDLMNITLKYLEKLSNTIQQVTEGDYDVSVEVEYEDELGALATNINILAETLKKKEEESEILKENERLALIAERSAENQKNELITNVAHDLRTPLTTIVGYLDLLRSNQNLKSEDVRKYAQVAYDKSIRLQTMMDDLFEFTKLDSPNIVVHMTTINISELILQITDEFYPDFAEHNLTPVISVSDAQLYTKGDGQLLARVFDNLISNAIKYGRDGEKLLVEVTNDEETITIKVRNYGSHISKDELTQIFDKFYRADSSRSSKSGGTGLGLAIAKNIVVHIHKGNIFATSHDDVTTFVVILNRVHV